MNDVFNETLTTFQCNLAVTLYSLDKTYCSSTDYGGYSGVSSTTNMTIELCLIICSSYSFKYAGLER